MWPTHAASTSRDVVLLMPATRAAELPVDKFAATSTVGPVADIWPGGTAACDMHMLMARQCGMTSECLMQVQHHIGPLPVMQLSPQVSKAVTSDDVRSLFLL